MTFRESRTDRAAKRYAKLLVLFPSAFRRRFGRSVVDLFRDRYREAARRGRGAVAWLWVRMIVNVIVHGFLERFMGIRGGLSRIRSGFWGDVKSAATAARRARGFTFAAIGCLALGIAASGAVLTLFSAAILRPLPFPDQDRLVRVWSVDPGNDARAELSYPDVLDLQRDLTMVDRLVATARGRLYFLLENGARRVEGEAVTPGYFELLGLSPVIGRLFGDEDHSQSSLPTMLLSHGTWTTYFGADPSVLGSTLNTSGKDYTIIGVLPPGFYGTIEEDIPDLEFWVPIAHELDPPQFTRRDVAGIWTIGRLAPGVTLAQGQQEVEEFGRRLAQAYPDTRGPYELRMEPFGANWREGLRAQNYLLLIAAGLLLLVATTNVAGLLMTRMFDRRREFSLRAALGASRWRIVRQVFVETLMLTSVGATLGLGLAPLILRSFLRIAPDEVPLYVDVAPDLMALGLAVVVVTIAAFAAAGVPAVVGLKVSPAQVLRGGGRRATSDRSERRAGASLVVAEVALSTIVIVAAGLLVRSYQSMSDTNLGFRTDGILRLAIFPTDRDVASVDQLTAFGERMRASLLEEPGVENVALMWPAVFPTFGVSARVNFAGLPDDLTDHGLGVNIHAVDPAFFPLMEIPLLAGRNVTSTDDADARSVIVVSESVAEYLGGSESAIGQTMGLGSLEATVVGVVGDVVITGPVNRRQRDVDVYRPIAQMPQRLISIAVRTDGDPRQLIAPLRQRLARLAPSSPLDWVNPLTTEIADRMEGHRFYVLLLGAFAWSAVILTAVGIFAVLANQVARQTSDFGVRRALGAGDMRILSEVMQRGIRVAALGLLLGGAAAIWLAPAAQSVISGIGRFDVVAFGGAAAVILVVASMASYLPAARAARTPTAEVLRAD